MRPSTKDFVKIQIIALMDQCGISIADIRAAVNEIDSDELTD